MVGILYIIIPVLMILGLNTIPTIRNYIYQYLSEFLTAFGAIGLTLIDIMSDSDKIFVGDNTWEDSWGLLLIFFFIILLSAIVVSAKRNKHNLSLQEQVNQNKNLEREIELYHKEYYNLCSNNILYLFKGFFTSGNERISIYKHQGSHFTLLGRYAKNPSNNSQTTYEYKDNEGLIGKAWNEGELTINDAPKWVKNGREYKKFMRNNCNITDSRLGAIRMKSQSFYIRTLNDDNTSENPDGIIVFESISPTKIIKEECRNLINDNEQAVLSLLQNMKSLTRKVQ